MGKTLQYAGQEIVGTVKKFYVTEVISLDFITRLPRSKKHNDSIMVVLDRLSKSTHFIHVQSTYKMVQIADIFMREIFIFHGIPKTVISDMDVRFTLAF